MTALEGVGCENSLLLMDATTHISVDGAPASRGEAFLRLIWRGALGLLALLLVVLAILVAAGDLYAAGSDLGYNLGLAGGVMILSLLLYPLRKRIRMLERLGAMNTWFRYHMFIGVAGPVLVVFHSSFKLKSMNGTVAFLSMLLVMLSGVVGRFLYRHVHRGLYGRKLTLGTVQDDIQACVARLVSLFALQHNIETRLRDFKESAFAPSSGFFHGIWRFATLSSRARALSRAIRAEIRPMMVRNGIANHLTEHQIILEYKLTKEQLNAYLDAIVKAAQLSTWERAFALWHLIHLPFLYLLVISGVVHVVAVHMY